MKDWYKIDTTKRNAPTTKFDEFPVKVNNAAEHGLPKRFLTALNELFDILDDNKNGCIKLCDIDERWIDDDNPGAPKGFMSCLRKVTPSNGIVTFDVLCAAVKICLLRNQALIDDVNDGHGLHNEISNCMPQPPFHLTVSARPASVPVPENQCSTPSSSSTFSTTKTFDERAKSLPLLRKDLRMPNDSSGDELRHFHSESRLKSEPKVYSKSKIMNVLRDWRNSVLERRYQMRPPYISREEIAANNRFHGPRALMRREARRHTVSHGIDMSSIRRLQQFEQEKSVLLHGLEMIERAKDWYLRKISSVQSKIRFLDHGGPQGSEYFLDSNQERINLQATRILAVNQQLSALIDSERGFASHMNLAYRPPNINHIVGRNGLTMNGAYNAFDRMKIHRLQQQNHLLTEEVGRKCDRITQLERDKSALIKELYNVRSSKPVNHRMPENETVAFM